MYDISAARNFISKSLIDAGIYSNINSENNSAAKEADLILINILNVTQAFILGHPEKVLTHDKQDLIKKIVARRIIREPLQYILGEAYFWDMPFKVGEGVLIPRPETEFLVEAALKYLPIDLPSFFLDWGTGSGCIAIALLKERPKARAVMAEKNPRSIMWAWKNLKRYNLHERALLWHSSELDNFINFNKFNNFDLIISNPPYVSTQEIAGLMPEVSNYEPHMALDGGKDGMDFYRNLLNKAPVLLKNKGTLVLEIGNAFQSKKIKSEYLKPKNSNLVNIMTLLEEIPDFSGNPRCIACNYSI